MTSSQRPADARSDWVFGIHDLGRGAGLTQTVQRCVAARENLGVALIGVPEGTSVDLDLRLESVVEGVLVTGTARVELQGECARCLIQIADGLEVDFQELYAYPDSEVSDDEAARIENDLIDLEPVVRDEVLVELPFRPLCREDCRGLCLSCGINLNNNPHHAHDEPVDPRWASLASFIPEGHEPGTGDRLN